MRNNLSSFLRKSFSGGKNCFHLGFHFFAYFVSQLMQFSTPPFFAISLILTGTIVLEKIPFAIDIAFSSVSKLNTGKNMYLSVSKKLR